MENMRQRLTKAVRCAIIMRTKGSSTSPRRYNEQSSALFWQSPQMQVRLLQGGKIPEKNDSNKDNTSQPIPFLHSSIPISDSINPANYRSTDEADFSFSSTCTSNSALDSSVSNISSSGSRSCEILELTDIETQMESFDQFLQDQELAWQDATSTTTMDFHATDSATILTVTDSDATDSATIPAATDSDATAVSLDPTHPIDHQMICDIKAIASRLASKSHQLLGV